MEETKTYQADERMQKFFNKLLDLKSFVKTQSDKSKDPILRQIYEKLDEIIKEKK